MIRNEKVREQLYVLHVCLRSRLSTDQAEHVLHILTSYIEGLERENYGLRIEVDDYARKERSRKKEMG